MANEMNSHPQLLRQRVQELLDDGTLTRFGPMFDIERVGGAFTLAALAVPEQRFDAVAEQLHAVPEVAHNYRPAHAWNMWLVLACATPQAVHATLRHIQPLAGLPVLDPANAGTHHLGLH